MYTHVIVRVHTTKVDTHEASVQSGSEAVADVTHTCLGLQGGRGGGRKEGSMGAEGGRRGGRRKGGWVQKGVGKGGKKGGMGAEGGR